VPESAEEQADGEESSTTKGWTVFAEEFQQGTEADPDEKASGFRGSGIRPRARGKPEEAARSWQDRQ
jgi:hypothetical protein